MSFASKAFLFHKKLHYTGGPLPTGIRVMNPFLEHPEALRVTKLFLGKYFNDDRPRRLILGINPGRLGGGLTGIPFTDPKRLVSECGIGYHGPVAHEPSSVFIYDMIRAYGGPDNFYNEFYINSPSPLGYTAVNKAGREVNYNYYDSPALQKAATPFIVESIRKLVRIGIHTDRAFCLGTGKNAAFLQALNKVHGFFDEIVPLEHPRYIMQYKQKQKDEYISRYLRAFHPGA
ncbi:MAG: SMUG2 DNA glycosylase family protein [Chitinophagaceae bacterium]|nr:MAG: SMUG2 DNA glycosylase family protein [Chitinophagaceae bacterium]